MKMVSALATGLIIGKTGSYTSKRHTLAMATSKCLPMTHLAM